VATQYALARCAPDAAAQLQPIPYTCGAQCALLPIAVGIMNINELMNIRCKRVRHNIPTLLQVDLWPFDIESGVQVTCDVGYLCANFSPHRLLCSPLRPDVRDRQTSDRQTSDVREIIAYCPALGYTHTYWDVTYKPPTSYSSLVGDNEKFRLFISWREWKLRHWTARKTSLMRWYGRTCDMYYWWRQVCVCVVFVPLGWRHDVSICVQRPPQLEVQRPTRKIVRPSGN